MNAEVPSHFSHLVEYRRFFVRKHANLAGIGLEVGAFARPTLQKHEANIRFVDFFSTEELRDQARRNGEDPNAVVPVDYVVSNDDYRSAAPGTFDYIIANHVFEHVLNPIAWLEYLNDMLHPGGLLFLTVPDKKYNFDRYRADTQLSHLLHDYIQGNDQGFEHSLETSLYYDLAYVNRPMELTNQLDFARMKRDCAYWAPGIHAHVFQGETFLAKILKPLLMLKLFDFDLVDFHNCVQFGEFAVVLAKQPPTVTLELGEFYQALPSPREPVPLATPSAPSAPSEPAPQPLVAFLREELRRTHSELARLYRWNRRHAQERIDSLRKMLRARLRRASCAKTG